MPETIYVVEGRTGEYSDRIEWPVAAYRDENMAKAHVVLAEAWDREHGREWYDSGWRQREAVKPPYDPNYQRDYTGTFYHYYAIEIADALPQVEVKG